MDRNTILGIILIAAIFIVWGIVSQPSAEQREAQKRRLDSLQQVQMATEKKEKSAVDTTKALPETTTKSAPADTLSGDNARKLFGDFGNAAVGHEKLITIENNLIKLTISAKGGRPYSVELKKYQTYDSLPLILFSGDSAKFGLNFYNQNRHINTNDLYFKSLQQSDHLVVTDKPDTVTMRLNAGGNRYIEYKYTVRPGSYMVDLSVKFSGLNNITARSNGIIDLNWSYYVPQQEKGRRNELYYTTLYYRPYQENVDYLSPRSKKQEEVETIRTKVDWVAYKDQFFSSVLMADNSFTDADMRADLQPDSSKFLKRFESTVGLPFDNGKPQVVPLHFYFGPNKYKMLKKLYGDEKLQDLVTVGHSIIKWINQLVIINLFDWLSKFISNYRIIILIMTILIKLALLPLTFKSYMSTAKMKVLKPQIDEINARIPKDKAVERQQATMALYKKVGVSPLGGCLPMLLQMPILYAMFRFFPTSIELRQQSFLWAHDLSTYDAIFEWHQHIRFISDIYGNHVSLFTLLMTVTTLISMKMTNQTNTANQQMPGMQTMMYIMPVTFMVFLNRYSAGLTYYYFLANLITIGQNYLFKLFVDDKEILSKLEARKAKPVKKSGFQKRLEQMAKQQQQAKRPGRR